MRGFGASGLLTLSLLAFLASGPASLGAVLEARDDKGLASCNNRLKPGDTCRVAPGTYTTPIHPSRNGKDEARIVYSCAGEAPGDCVIDTDGPDSLALAGNRQSQGAGSGGLSYITVEGFTFEDGPVRAAGRGSRGIILRRVATRDRDNQRPCSSVTTEGGDGTLFEAFDFFQPSRSSNAAGARAGCDVMSLGTNAGEGGEQGTTLRGGRIRGGWNALQIGRCIGCVLDGVVITGAKNHTLSVGGSGARTENLEIRNSIVMASTGFREPVPFVAWQVSGLTLLNNAIITGWAIPAFGDASIRHEATVRGPITIRNNIFYSDRPSTLGLANNGTFAAKNPLAWSVDHNAYVGAGGFGASLWTDSRDCSLGSGGKLAGSGCPEKSFTPGPKGEVAPGWRAAGFDTRSIVFENTDYATGARKSSFPVRGPLWGATGPYSGAMVECLLPGAGAFAADRRWGAGIRVGDRVEYDFDGTLRTVSAVQPKVACGGGENRVGVTLDPPARLRPNAWVLSFGAQEIRRSAYEFVPQAGSPVIDAGDDEHCAHPVKGAHCDIGPVEAEAPGPAQQGAAAAKPADVPGPNADLVPPAPAATPSGAVGAGATAGAAGEPETAGAGSATGQAGSTETSGVPETAPAPAVDPSAGPQGGTVPPAAAASGTGTEPAEAGAKPMWDPRISGIGLGSTARDVREALGKPLTRGNGAAGGNGAGEKRPNGERKESSDRKPREGRREPRERRERESKETQGEENPDDPRPAAQDASAQGAAQRTAGYEGLTLTLERSAGGADFLLVQWTLSGDKYEFTPGVKIGLSREEVIGLLGEPASVRSVEEGKELLVYPLAGGKGHARIVMRDGKVVEVKASARSEKERAPAGSTRPAGPVKPEGQVKPEGRITQD